ncbi:MAG: hypothetical protein AB2L22_13645 [Syntrophales bacterium]
MDEWLIGRKAITKELGVTWRTVRRWKRNRLIVLRKTPSGKPALLKSEIQAWFLLVNRLVE